MSLQVEVIKKAYLQGEVEFENLKEEEDNGEEEEHDAASPRNVGHNIYILAHQVFYYLCLQNARNMHYYPCVVLCKQLTLSPVCPLYCTVSTSQ